MFHSQIAPVQRWKDCLVLQGLCSSVSRGHWNLLSCTMTPGNLLFFFFLIFFFSVLSKCSSCLGNAWKCNIRHSLKWKGFIITGVVIDPYLPLLMQKRSTTCLVAIWYLPIALSAHRFSLSIQLTHISDVHHLWVQCTLSQTQKEMSREKVKNLKHYRTLTLSLDGKTNQKDFDWALLFIPHHLTFTFNTYDLGICEWTCSWRPTDEQSFCFFCHSEYGMVIPLNTCGMPLWILSVTFRWRKTWLLHRSAVASQLKAFALIQGRRMLLTCYRVFLNGWVATQWTLEHCQWEV